MICFPNAKINIGLNITGKRDDGFHNVESVMYPLKGIVYEALEIIPLNKGKEAKLILSGIPVPGNTENNLCIRAHTLIKKDYPVPPVKIHLHKAIPIGAGLGGGSADAAFFIRLLNDMFQLGISWGEMHHYARQLGSDCSFFISNKPVFAEGKGDQLESLNLSLSGYHLVLVYPDIHINTAMAYTGVHPKKPTRSLENDVLNLPVEQWKESIHNDFEDSIFVKYPEIKKIKEKLYSIGAVYASMSGSGSAVYGLFKKEVNTKKYFKAYSVWKGKL